MTFKERHEINKRLFEQVLQLTASKGSAYAGQEDTFANFKKNAGVWGLSKYQVWGVYAGKHWDGISNAIRYTPDAPIEATEGMSGRILDMITYLTILYGMLVEDELIEERI